ncbi:TNT domain-containing protein [Saccharomonospora sp. CUA-673]|uniref:TNT domain-containing protein n=1 Tax=Saccharomonospora sp. CUA-673 TaxID=1904969 RepID=UPI0035144CBC
MPGTHLLAPAGGSAPAPPREPIGAHQQAAPTRHTAPAEPRHGAGQGGGQQSGGQQGGGSGQGSGGQQWPIQPLPGEPPLTLFRGKEMTTLPVGSELDRFGGSNGNLTYAAGTPFEERSLVPEWVNRPYHVYRVQRPLEALAGVAIPWFNQPGGGAAYMLPASIEELLADGDVIELDPGEPPVD